MSLCQTCLEPSEQQVCANCKRKLIDSILLLCRNCNGRTFVPIREFLKAVPIEILPATKGYIARGNRFISGNECPLCKGKPSQGIVDIIKMI